MRIGVNQFSFPQSYDVAEAIAAARRLGFDSIELCFTNAPDSAGSAGGGVTDALDISGYVNRLLNVRSTQKDVSELRKICDDNGIAVSSVSGIVTFSIYPLNARDAGVAQKAMDAVRRMMDAACILGGDTVQVMTGILTEEMGYQESYDRAQARIAQLADHNPDIRIGIENVWNNMLYSPLELNRFVDETGRRNVGVYFDIANARRFGYPQQWIREMNRRIVKYHLKDYRMSVDNINGFTNMLDGDVNYPEVMKAIRETGYDGDLIVELVPPARHMVENTLEYARKTTLNLLK